MSIMGADFSTGISAGCSLTISGGSGFGGASEPTTGDGLGSICVSVVSEMGSSSVMRGFRLAGPEYPSLSQTSGYGSGITIVMTVVRGRRVCHEWS